MNTPIPTDVQALANYLTTGFWNDVGYSTRSWTQNTITYNLSNEFSNDQKEGLRLAFNLWSDAADIEFNEVSTTSANIKLIESDDQQASSTSSLLNGALQSSSISIDTNVANGQIWSDFNDLGNYALLTAIHEIGHSLGLGHTGNYNGSASYAEDAQWAIDTHQMSVMSYFNVNNIGSDHRDSANNFQYPATPMLADILAIQMIYGADYDTRSENTVYGFNATTIRPQFHFETSEVPVTIWDGGGLDTIDVSGYATTQILSLIEGQYSSIGYMTDNLVIAYGAQIENAIGGTGTDIIYGNAGVNDIRSGAGDDILYASAGGDTLDGEDGQDTVIYQNPIANFAFTMLDTLNLAITNIADTVTDTIRGVEDFIFGTQSYTLEDIQNNYVSITLPAIFTDIRWADNTEGFFYASRATENTIFTAQDIDLSQTSAQQFTINRTVESTIYTIADSHALETMQIVATNDPDIIIIKGQSSGEGEGETTLSATIYSGYGDDIITASAGNDTLVSGLGADTLNGGAGNDALYAGNQNDTLNGDDGDDSLYGGFGEDLLNGGKGNDILLGNNDNDILNGGEGDDALYGLIHDDILNGGEGNDILDGGHGNDILDGGNGNDFLFSSIGDDTLIGGAGNDWLSAGAGDDTLLFGEGRDILYGGSGNNVFALIALDNEIDQIRDFTLNGANADTLNITDIITGYNSTTDDINDFVSLIYTNFVQSRLYINADGQGDDAQQAAIIRGSDFAGVTINDLINSNQLITDLSVL